MYFKRKMRRGISTALIAAMTVGNALTVSAAPVGEWDHKAELLQGNGENGFDPNALGLPYMSFSRTGRVVKIVAKGDAEEIVARLNAFHPLFIEEIPVDFEELFTYEVESRGYLK